MAKQLQRVSEAADEREVRTRKEERLSLPLLMSLVAGGFQPLWGDEGDIASQFGLTPLQSCTIISLRQTYIRYCRRPV